MKKSIGINQTAFATPLFVVGTYDKNGRPDAATLAWVGVASSDPPSLAIAVRPSRYTYDNLLLKRAFTVNIPSSAYAVEADYLGIASGRDEDKFEKAGLHAVKAEYVDAPAVDEFPVSIECEVSHTLDLGAHTLFIGTIKDIKAEDTVLGENDVLNIRGAELLSFDPTAREYFVPGEVAAKAFSAGTALRH
jgi:flavin reductase (DIM6/NTAB) family NADH-FMN oxidoreductase RutF